MKKIEQTIMLAIRKADNSGDESHDRLYYATVSDSVEGIDQMCVFAGDGQLVEFVTKDIINDASDLQEGETLNITITLSRPVGTR